MSNEASKIELYGHNSAGEVISYTISDSVEILKGTLMVLSASPRTAAAHSTGGQVFLGIANADKDSTDSSDQLGVWTNGIFLLAASSSINDGDPVVLDIYPNYVVASQSVVHPGKLVGIAQSDASGGLVPVRILK